jgi:hypothetical protein
MVVAQVSVLNTVEIPTPNFDSICLVLVRVDKVLTQREGFSLKVGDVQTVVLPGGSCLVVNKTYPRAVAAGERYVLLLRGLGDCHDVLLDTISKKFPIDLVAVGDKHFTVAIKPGSENTLEFNGFAEFFGVDQGIFEDWVQDDLAYFFRGRLAEFPYTIYR